MNSTEAAAPSHPPKHKARRVFRAVGFAVLGLLLLVGTLWAAAALYFEGRAPVEQVSKYIHGGRRDKIG